MIVLKLLISVFLAFTALGLACAVWVALVRAPRGGRRGDAPADPHAEPYGDVPYSRAQLEALTRRADARAAKDPMGLRRPLFFSQTVPQGAATGADGGHSVPTEVPAIRRPALGAVPDRFARCAASSRADSAPADNACAPLGAPPCCPHCPDSCEHAEICRALDEATARACAELRHV